MIEVYTGTPGSGKSYHAVQDIVKALRSGKKVISNLWIDESKVKKNKGEFIYVQDFKIRHLLSEFAKGNALIVIDECQVYLGSRSWLSDNDRDVWLRFFQLHRHVNINVILITQDIEMIDKQVRNIAEYENKHLSIRRVKLFRWICILFRVNLMLVKVVNCPSQIKLYNEFRIGRPKYYRLYDTSQIVKNGDFVKWCLGVK